MPEQTGEWVRRKRETPRHECQGPTPIQSPHIILGDLWRCGCGRLLQVRELGKGSNSRTVHMPVWKRARPHLRVWHGIRRFLNDYFGIGGDRDDVAS